MSALVDKSAIAEEYGVTKETVSNWIKQGLVAPEIHIGQVCKFDPEKVRKQLMKATEEKRKSAKSGNFQVPTR